MPSLPPTADGSRASSGSMFLYFEPLRDRFTETFNAVRHAAAQVPAEQRMRTQGHVLSCGDMLRTLAVEATIHHLDFLPADSQLPAPSALGLAEARRTIELLLGQPLPSFWDDAHCALVATGRAAVSDDERRLLGGGADRLPVFT